MITYITKQVMAFKSLSNFSLEDDSLFDHTDVKSNIFQEVEPEEQDFNQEDIVYTLMPTDFDAQESPENDVPEESIEEAIFTEEITFTEEATFLPSKIRGKSEITLLPIKREQKSCGHDEPCENIICDVNVQQYVDHHGSSPMLAVNIDDSEINAKVSKHCNNSLCDALSIDHNRCRRAIIRLNRCDKSNACDICGILLKTRKSRIHHRNCKRTNEYRHNPVDGAQILRERMRERELQIMEAVRARKNDYNDPITGYNKAIEVLKNNSELIVIPKGIAPLQLPVVNHQITTNVITNPVINGVSSQNIDNLLKNLPKISITNAHIQDNVLIKKSNSSDRNETSSNHIKIDSKNNATAGDNKFIITAISQPTVPHSLVINDWVMTQPEINSETNLQNPYFMPVQGVRVLPITNLKSKPSLLHQTQGIPKFCIISDNSPASGGTLFNISPIASTQSSPAPKSKTLHKPSILLKSSHIPIKPKPTTPGLQIVNYLKPSRYEILSRRKKIEQKPFECQYCSKRFLTDWYFKLHLIKHKGQMNIKCSLCELSFSNNDDLNRHVFNEHNDTVEILCRTSDSDVEKDKEDDKYVACEDCGKIFDSDTELDQHECINVNDLVSSQTNLLISSEN